MKINSREQFQYALHAGHGSAQLYVQQHGIESVADIILDACLKDRSYDRQCEECRAAWLAGLFFNTIYYPEFVQKIITTFQATTDHPYHDAVQLYTLLCELAKRGNHDAYVAAQTVLTTQLAQHDISVDYASEWLAVVGLEALPDIAASIGFRLLNIDDSWNYPLESLLPSQFTPEEARTFLKAKALENPLIQTYLDHDEKFTAEQAERERTRKIVPQAEHIRSVYSLKQLLIDSGSDKLPHLQQRNIRVFGEFATLEERIAIQDQLEQAQDKHQLINLLMAFHQAELPALTPRIWELARSQDTEIRAKALTALSNSEHPDVYTFALEQLKDTRFLFETPQVLKLFELNFKAGDAEHILNAIKNFKPTLDDDSKDQAEALGRIFNAIAESQQSSEVIPLLHWSYENLPCSLCRFTSLNRLKNLNALTPDILQACLYDANSDTRELAQTLQEPLK